MFYSTDLNKMSFLALKPPVVYHHRMGHAFIFCLDQRKSGGGGGDTIKFIEAGMLVGR